jgi:hypothetical protein
MKNRCYLCKTTDTIHELDNICQDCLDKETD